MNIFGRNREVMQQDVVDPLLLDLERFRKMDEEFNEVIFNSFKGLMAIEGNGQSGPEFRAYMHKKNKFYLNTEYYYKEKKEFFHLTTINNLISILNSRTFRMYNLNAPNDPEEYSYVGNILELDKWQIKNAKEHTYTFSFCPISELINPAVWNMYGSNLHGVAIIFEIINDPGDWYNYHISNIKYETPENFIYYKKAINELNDKYPGYKFNSDLSHLISFHKTSKWKEEKEVRLATHLPYIGIEEMWKYSKPDIRLEKDRNRIVSYIELPLWVDNDSRWLKCDRREDLNRTSDTPADHFIVKPKIIIKEIKVGINCGIDEREFDTYRRMIREIFQLNYGYDVHIEHELFSF